MDWNCLGKNALEYDPSFALQSEQNWDNLQGRSHKIVVFNEFLILDFWFQNGPLPRRHFLTKIDENNVAGEPILKLEIETYKFQVLNPFWSPDVLVRQNLSKMDVGGGSPTRI